MPSAGLGEKPEPASNISLVTVGVIVNINARKKTFDISSEKELDPSAPDLSKGGLHGEVWIGGGRGRGGILSDRSRRGDASEWPPEPGRNGEVFDREVRTTVTTNEKTQFTAREANLVFEELRVGDTVEVTGTVKGLQMEARKVLRTRSGSQNR